MINKRGSAIVEAALVFPVIILSLMAVICIYVYFYDQVQQQAEVHSVLRSEAGLICENMYNRNQNETELPVYRQTDRIYCYSHAVMEGNGMLKKAEHQIRAQKYITDDTSVVRLADFVKGEQAGYE